MPCGSKENALWAYHDVLWSTMRCVVNYKKMLCVVYTSPDAFCHSGEDKSKIALEPLSHKLNALNILANCLISRISSVCSQAIKTEYPSDNSSPIVRLTQHDNPTTDVCGARQRTSAWRYPISVQWWNSMTLRHVNTACVVKHDDVMTYEHSMIG